MIEVWQQRLIEMAARIIVRRKRYIHSLKNRLNHLENLFGEARESRVSVSYEAGGLPGGDEDAEEEIRERLLTRAQSLAKEEMARKTTLWGPQLDDFHFSWDGRRAKDVASQGEQRLITILLVSANAEEYKERRKETPIVLLDDLGSELDADRKKRVLLFLGSLGAQTFITSTEEPRLSENEIEGRTFLGSRRNGRKFRLNTSSPERQQKPNGENLQEKARDELQGERHPHSRRIGGGAEKTRHVHREYGTGRTCITSYTRSWTTAWTRRWPATATR